ncbi:hypothetical protein WICMUC_003525 [Wickerhamomyces mucosus]|uniref:Protein ZIP4 homolog n=1 Tax=Wickerhamomyces mucosus TaxID=1378264 RepID=A0A9P8PK68_9ASCO|nr:hypothetical protein WICMUC_003525 [Wickerhamomyces mucosus]
MSNLKPQLSQIINTAHSTAAKLEGKVSEADNAALKSSIDSILPLAERFERLLHTMEVDDLADSTKQIELVAIKLWNSATLSMKEDDMKTLLLSIKLFSSLLFSIEESLGPTIKRKFRLMNCFYKTLRDSIDEYQLSIASKVQQYSDRCFKSLEAISESFDEAEIKQFNKFRAELFITKMQLSVIEDDIQMAKFYEEKAQVMNCVTANAKDYGVELFRIIYNTCIHLFENSHHDDVIYFLSRRLDISSVETSESKTIKESICSLLVRSVIESPTEEHLNIAESAIKKMESLNPSSMDVFMLGIQLSNLKNNPISNVEEIVMRMVMSVPIRENFKGILGMINEHGKENSANAIRCYEYIFTNRLNPIDDHDNLELVFIAMLNAYIKDAPDANRHEKLLKFLDIAERMLSKPISKKCSSSAVTLLWSFGKSKIKNSEFADAVSWLKLTLHKVILINEVDQAKVQRALQNAYIQLNEFENAIKYYEEMSTTEKNCVLTQYNMFKVYTHQENEIEVLKCLGKISDSSEKNILPILTLCASSTTVNTRIALETILVLLKKLDKDVGIDISIPTTLRSVIELILKEDNPEYLCNLLILFREAYKFAKDCKHIKNYKFSDEELKWFCSQAFNISRSCLVSKDFTNGEFFSGFCIDFISLISDGITFEESFGLKLWKFRAELIALMCVYESGKSEIILNDLKKRSIDLKISIEEVLILIQQKEDFSQFKKELGKLFLDSLIFEFESDLGLGNWESVEANLKYSMKFSNPDFDSTLVNLVIQGSHPENIKVMVLYEVISRNFYTVSKVTLSRWVRLLLKNSNLDLKTEEICFKVVNNTANIMSQDDRLPSHEIEWISTTCWNNGINKLFNDEKSRGEKWCTMALKMAGFVNERFELTLNEMWDELNMKDKNVI